MHSTAMVWLQQLTIDSTDGARVQAARSAGRRHACPGPVGGGAKEGRQGERGVDVGASGTQQRLRG